MLTPLWEGQSAGKRCTCSAAAARGAVDCREEPDGSPACWETTVSTPGNVKQNDATHFKATSD